LLGSLLAVAYVWKLVEVMYFKRAIEPDLSVPQGAAIKEAPLMLLIPTWILVLANIYFGFDTDLTVGVAEKAVEQLLLGANK
jgi:multicomponent Na+:H+ antiporter subunit D